MDAYELNDKTMKHNSFQYLRVLSFFFIQKNVNKTNFVRNIKFTLALNDLELHKEIQIFRHLSVDKIIVKYSKLN